MDKNNTEINSQKLGHFRNEAAEKLYKQSYQKAMDTLPAPTRSLDIPTDYGTVRVYEFKNNETKPDTNPIVLLPGRSSGVPMWGLNLSGLVGERTVYAMDALGDAGLSVQTRLLKNADDQAAWLEQTFEHLGLRDIHLVGHSFGGWLAANYAIRSPSRLKSLNLLEPVFVFQGLRWQVYLQATIAILPFVPQSFRDKMLSKIGGGAKVDRNDPIAALVANATSSFNTKVPQPVQITIDQLKNLSMPVYAAIGGKSAMHNPDAVINVAESNLKNSQVKLWPNGTHSLPMEFPTEIDGELLAFMDSVDKIK